MTVARQEGFLRVRAAVVKLRRATYILSRHYNNKGVKASWQKKNTPAISAARPLRASLTRAKTYARSAVAPIAESRRSPPLQGVGRVPASAESSIPNGGAIRNRFPSLVGYPVLLKSI